MPRSCRDRSGGVWLGAPCGCPRTSSPLPPLHLRLSIFIWGEKIIFSFRPLEYTDTMHISYPSYLTNHYTKNVLHIITRLHLPQPQPHTVFMLSQNETDLHDFPQHFNFFMYLPAWSSTKTCKLHEHSKQSPSRSKSCVRQKKFVTECDTFSRFPAAL